MFLFFNVIYYLSFIALVCFVLIDIVGFSFPTIGGTISDNYYLLYTQGLTLHSLQNQGMFWEPGAFAGILPLCLILNFNNLNFYFNHDRLKLIIVIIALLTTQSITIYISFFLIIMFYFITIKNRFLIFVFAPVLVLLSIYLYTKTDFLSSKIEDQYSSAKEQSIGELYNTRFGSIVFDWYYIKKHPSIGNGIHEKTRYEDHQYLFFGAKGEDLIASGNWRKIDCWCLFGSYKIIPDNEIWAGNPAKFIRSI
jgi:O-antigen ligase